MKTIDRAEGRAEHPTGRKRSGGALRNASWNAFATLCSIVVTFFLAPVLIHRLGEDQWGLLLIVWSITGVLAIANFGVGEATLRFIAHYQADGEMRSVNRVMGATLTFYVSVCTVITAGVFIAAPVLSRWVNTPKDGTYPMEWLVRLSAALFSVGMISNAFRCVPMAVCRYDISSRIGLGQSIGRSVGFIALAVAGFGVLHMVLWELVLALIVAVVQIAVARRLLPGLRWTPAMSFEGIREIFGYSVYSFLTHIFLTIYREGGKLILGNRLGTASVAYLGTPDSVAHRLHTVIVSGIETLMPRFSATRDPAAAKSLLLTATWFATACGVSLYLPMALLIPDFLGLWISPTFAAESGPVGRLLTLSMIAPCAFAPLATLFRGIGRPGFVTVVMVVAGLLVLGSTLALVSSHGPRAVGVGYLLSSVAWLGGLTVGWLQWCGRGSLRLLWRVSGLPLAIGCALGGGEYALWNWLGSSGWPGLFLAGGTFASVNALVLLGADRLMGGDSPSGRALRRVLQSERIASLLQRMGRPFSPVRAARA